jgi:hypothetical protein
VECEPNSLYLTVNQNRDLYNKLFLANAVESVTTQSPSWDIPNPTGDNNWYIMTNLEGKIKLVAAKLYNLRNWIEYSFKKVKNALG